MSIPHLESSLICVLGKSGTGKSNLAKNLTDYFHLHSTSAGEIFDAISASRKIDPQLLEQQTDFDIDAIIDDTLHRHGSEYMSNGGGILEGRRVQAIFPRSTSILLFCDDDVRIRRIADRDHGGSVAEAYKITTEREKATDARYYKKYREGFRELFNPLRFTLHFNTSILTEKQVCKMAVENIKILRGM